MSIRSSRDGSLSGSISDFGDALRLEEYYDDPVHYKTVLGVLR